jgi:phosphoribosyl 1,2-cyclic phosphodiesterase
MHSSLLVSYYDQRIMIDCGLDWLEEVEEIDPDIIFITHAHPDHAFGLQEGSPCPVCATEESWEKLADCEIETQHTVAPREMVQVGDISFEAFPVDHSTIAPAVGYRIAEGRRAIFYVPDVGWIHDREQALSGLDLYIGDGASIEQSLVRKMEETLVGHTPIRTQLTWCQKEGVPKALFTHCGTEIVESDFRKVNPKLEALA